MVSVKDIKQLREETGVGMMDCKAALKECGGDVQAAKVYMRKQGVINAKSRGHKATPEGTIGFYSQIGNRICAMVEVNSETDFVARNKDFQDFAHDLAIHVAAAKPLWLDKDSVPADVIAVEKDIILSDLENKPPQVQEKIMTGKLNKFFKDNCLMEQSFVKDQKVSVQDLYDALCLKLKERIVVKRFSRFEIGL